MLFVRQGASVLILQKEALAQSQAGAFKAYLHKVQMSLCVETNIYRIKIYSVW